MWPDSRSRHSLLSDDESERKVSRQRSISSSGDGRAVGGSSRLKRRVQSVDSPERTGRRSSLGTSGNVSLSTSKGRTSLSRFGRDRSRDVTTSAPAIFLQSAAHDRERLLLMPVVDLLRRAHGQAPATPGSVRSCLESMIPDSWWAALHEPRILKDPPAVPLTEGASAVPSASEITAWASMSPAILSELVRAPSSKADDSHLLHRLMRVRPSTTEEVENLVQLVRQCINSVPSEVAVDLCFHQLTSSGDTVLHLAASKLSEPPATSPFEVIVALLELLSTSEVLPVAPPARPSQRTHVLYRCNASSYTPVMLMAMHGCANLLEATLLRLHPIRAIPMMNAANAEGVTALALAHRHGHAQVVMTLLRYGCRATLRHGALPRAQRSLVPEIAAFFDPFGNKEAMMVRTYRLLAGITSSQWKFKWWSDFVPFEESRTCFDCTMHFESPADMTHCFVCGFVFCSHCASSFDGDVSLPDQFFGKTYCQHCRLAFTNSSMTLSVAGGRNPFTSFYAVRAFLQAESFLFRSAEARSYGMCTTKLGDHVIWRDYLPLVGLSVMDVGSLADGLHDDFERFFCIRSLRKDALPLVKAAASFTENKAVAPHFSELFQSVDAMLGGRDVLHRSLLFVLYILMFKRQLPAEETDTLKQCFAYLSHSIMVLHEQLEARFVEERRFMREAAAETHRHTALAGTPNAPSEEQGAEVQAAVMWGERIQRWRAELLGMLQKIETLTAKLRSPHTDPAKRATHVLKYVRLEKSIKALLVETSQLDMCSDNGDLEFLRVQFEPLRARAAHILATPPVLEEGKPVVESAASSMAKLGGGRLKRLQEQVQSWSVDVQTLIRSAEKLVKDGADGVASEELPVVTHQLEDLESRVTHMMAFCSNSTDLLPLSRQLNDMYLVIQHHLGRLRAAAGTPTSSYALATVLEQDVLKLEMSILHIAQALFVVTPDDVYGEDDRVTSIYNKVVRLQERAAATVFSMEEKFSSGHVIPQEVVKDFKARLAVCQKKLALQKANLLSQFGVLIRSSSSSVCMASPVDHQASNFLLQKAEQKVMRKQLLQAQREHELIETEMFDL